MNQNPGLLKQFLTKPIINAKPAYEFYGNGYPALMGFHWGLTTRICDFTGRRLAPTYSYFRVYQKGDICTVHTDRESGEHSLSMALGYADNIVWPFEIGSTKYPFEETNKMKAAMDFGGESNTALELNPGDAVLYRGMNYLHGRMTPNPNRWSAHAYFQWIDIDGPYKEWMFDKQPILEGGDFSFPKTVA